VPCAPSCSRFLKIEQKSIRPNNLHFPFVGNSYLRTEGGRFIMHECPLMPGTRGRTIYIYIYIFYLEGGRSKMVIVDEIASDDLRLFPIWLSLYVDI
jgi:hypothetical protein